jgi:hypothetical protein
MLCRSNYRGWGVRPPSGIVYASLLVGMESRNLFRTAMQIWNGFPCLLTYVFAFFISYTLAFYFLIYLSTSLSSYSLRIFLLVSSLASLLVYMLVLFCLLAPDSLAYLPACLLPYVPTYIRTYARTFVLPSSLPCLPNCIRSGLKFSLFRFNLFWSNCLLFRSLTSSSMCRIPSKFGNSYRVILSVVFCVVTL